MHVGYALVVATSLVRYGCAHIARFLGLLYLPFVLLVVVATGNHFRLDALAGTAVVGLAAGASRFLVRPRAEAQIAHFPKRPAPVSAPEELAA
jgi:hypothetical protein